MLVQFDELHLSQLRILITIKNLNLLIKAYYYKSTNISINKVNNCSYNVLWLPLDLFLQMYTLYWL